MPDVQNFFHKALWSLQKPNIYTSEESFRRALLSDTFFQLSIQCMRKLYAHFNFLPYKLPLNRNVNALRLYCTDNNICVKSIQWHKLWYHFPVVIQRYFGEQAVSFKKVSLPESLLTSFYLHVNDIHCHYLHVDGLHSECPALLVAAFLYNCYT